MDPLFIKVIDNQPIDNPVYESNLIQAFGYVPPEYQPFKRVQQNVTPLIYENAIDSYQKVEGLWQDVWSVSEQTPEEKIATTEQINFNGVQQQELLISFANKTISTLKQKGDTQGVGVWQMYLNNLNNWVMPPINPNWTINTINYNFPEQPIEIANFNLGDGTGVFDNIETVYQSPDGTLENATCRATTQNYNGWTPGPELPVTYVSGVFETGKPIFGYTSFAHYIYISQSNPFWVIPT